MFSNAYQNGPYFEVWDSRAGDKNDANKQLARIAPVSNKKYYDKDIKSYIYGLEGSSKMYLPSADQRGLGLHQKYLVVHLMIPQGSSWSMEVAVNDLNGIKRRINLTTVPGKPEVKYFSVRYPLETIQRGCWLFLAVNLHSFMEAFKGQVHRSLEQLTLGSTCLVRRIFTMKEWDRMEIPKAFWLPPEVPQEMQLIEYHELVLPRINRSVKLEQVSPSHAGQKPKGKASKSNLIKSELTPKINKSKVFDSPSKKSYSKVQMFSQHHEPKQSLGLEHSESRQMQKSNKSVEGVSKQEKYFGMAADSKSCHQEKKLKASPNKSPIIQKLFQEDEALNYKPGEDSSASFESSRESFVFQNKRLEKWQEQPGYQLDKHDARSSQQPGTLVNVKKNNPVAQNRQVITKENSTPKIEKPQAKAELELIYDEMVGCYYHPETHTYYQLKS